MSTPPDQMPNQTPGLPGMDPAATGLPSMAGAQTGMQQFQDLQGKAAGVEQQASADTQQTLQQVQGMQPPKQNTGILDIAPFLIGLAAVSGKAMGLHATTMLAATNGMVKGMMQGSQKAYDDAQKQYDQTLQKLLTTWNMKQKAYETMVKAYEGMADAKYRAAIAAERMSQDSFKDKLAMQAQQMQGQKMQLSEREFAEKTKMDSYDRYMQQKELMLKMSDATHKWAHWAQQEQNNDLLPGAQALLGELATQGVSLPMGLRSQKALTNTLNAIVSEHPDETPQEIVQAIKSGQLDFTAQRTEMQVGARKEAATGAAITTLNQPGGLYDQLRGAAQAVDFGSAKFKNQVELGLQGKVVADPKIQFYVTKLQESRAELAQVFSRAGATTNKAREMAEEALPTTSSVAELNAAIDASQEAADSVASGNRAFMDAVKSGKGLTEALQAGKEDFGSKDTGSWGDLPQFNSEQGAEEAFKQGQIKKGDRVIVNGQPGTWQ